jgi:hypothetical protein
MQHHGGLARQLCRQLAEVRGYRRLSDIAAEMRCSTAKVSRIFASNRGVVAWADLVMLMDILNVDERTRREIIATWEAVRRAGPALADYADLLSRNEVEYYEAVQVADCVLSYTGMVLPFQVRALEYHLALKRPVERHRDAQSWAELLPLLNTALNPKRRMHLVMCETALMRWSTPGFQDSLDLLVAAHAAGVTIQFYPLAASMRECLDQGFSIIEWDDDPVSTLYSVTWPHEAVNWVSESKQHQSLRRSWDDLVAYSTDPRLLPAIVERARRQTEGERRDLIA